jgi:hypothetical protein
MSFYLFVALPVGFQLKGGSLGHKKGMNADIFAFLGGIFVILVIVLIVILLTSSS